MKNIKLMKKLEKAIDFLNDHPAVNQTCTDSFFNGNFLFWIMEASEEGVLKDKYEKPEHVTLNVSRSNTEKFNEICKLKGAKIEYVINKKKPSDNDVVIISYKEYYGKEWKLAKYVYCGECSFYIFDKNIKDKNDYKLVGDPSNWISHQGVYIKADSFEKLIIEMAKKVKENYGNFSFDDFYSPKEIKNHKKHSPVKFKKTEDKKQYEVLNNPKYIMISTAILNLRWFEWFKSTDFCGKHWKEYICSQ